MSATGYRSFAVSSGILSTGLPGSTRVGRELDPLGNVRMKILFISHSYYPFVGGIETQLRMMAKELSARHKVEVVALNFANSASSPIAKFLNRVLSIAGIEGKARKVLLVPAHQSFADEAVIVHSVTLSLLEKARFILLRGQGIRSLYIRKLQAIVKGADIVHSLDKSFLGRIAGAAARNEGVPYVITPYVHPDTKKQQYRAWFADQAAVVFALLESDASKLIEYGVDPVKLRQLGVVPLLPPTSDPEDFRARHGLGDRPVILFVGRIVEYKGVRALLDATRSVWRLFPHVNFVFAGPVGDEQEAWFADYEDDRIRLLGPVSEQEKADALAACDLFCMPSRYEILPAVYLEAWHYGKAVVGGPAYGLKELIEGNSAGVVIEQDPEALAKVLIDLLGDRARRNKMGKNGRALVQTRFSKETLITSLENTYRELLARGGRNNPSSVVANTDE